MRIASAVFTFARPEYYSQALASLEKCNEAKDIDWFVYQDNLVGHPEEKAGYDDITQENVEECIDITNNSTLPITEHYINPRNEGINYQVNRALSLLNEYDTVFFFEDDLVVSKHYLRLMRICASEHPDIMAMFNSSFVTSNSKHDLLVMVKAKRPRCWGFYLTKQAGKKFRKVWKRRYNPYRRSPYYDTTFTQIARSELRGKYFSRIARARNIGIRGVLSTNEKSWRYRKLHTQPERIQYQFDRKAKGFILS